MRNRLSATGNPSRYLEHRAAILVTVNIRREIDSHWWTAALPGIDNPVKSIPKKF